MPSFDPSLTLQGIRRQSSVTVLGSNSNNNINMTIIIIIIIIIIK